MTKEAIKEIKDNLKSKKTNFYLEFGEIKGTEKEIDLLAQCTHLEKLELHNNYAELEDLSFLKELKQLKSLHLDCLSSTQAQDISAIGYLQNLEELVLWYGAQNISALKHLKKLHTLFLIENQIQDISPLKGLYSLKTLNLYQNKIQDVSPLKNLYNLLWLTLGNNPIQNIETLKDLRLKNLDLKDCKISNLFALKELKKLKGLNLRNTKIEDMSLFEALPNLEQVSIDINSLPYPPIWYAHLFRRRRLDRINRGLIQHNENAKNLGDYINLPELPEVEKIWQIMSTKEDENINLAHQLALSQGWTEEDFEAYKSLLRLRRK